MLYIKLGEKELPFHFRIAAMEELALNEEGVFDFEKTSRLKMIYYGLKHGARKEGLEFTMTFEEMEDIFDEDPKQFSKAVEVLVLSNTRQSKNGKRPTKKERAV